MFNPLPVVRAEWRRSRAGSLAVVLLVAVAVAVGVAVSAQERALRDGSGRAADAFDLVVGAPGSETQLVLSTVYLQPASLDLVPGAVLAELTAHESVALAAPLAFGDSWRGHPVVGTIPAFLDHLAPLAEGRAFGSVWEAVVGHDVALTPGDDFTPAHGAVAIAGEDHRHEGVSYAVVGRLAPLGTPWDAAILVPVEAVWLVHALPPGHPTVDADGAPIDESALPLGPPWDADSLPGVPAIVVEPASFAAAYALRSRYRAAETMAVFPGEVLVQLYALLGDVRDVLATVSLLTQALVVAAILLAVLATLAARRRLVGVLRALGAAPLYVFAAVWLNVSLLIATGAALGLGLGWAAAYALSTVFSDRTGVALPVALGLPELGLAAGLGAVGLILATIPAALLYRQPIAAALRS